LPGWLAVTLLTPAILLIPAVFFRRRIYSRWQHRRQARRERESFFFRQFVKSAHSNDPKAALNSLMRWLDRIHTGSGAARLDLFLNQYGNNRSSAEAGRLERALSEGHCDWTGKPLAKAMRAARRHWQKARQTGKAMMSLPPLNPS
jgi:site-specific recombinase